MTDKFRASVDHGDRHTLIRLAGVLDEDNTLARLAKKVRGDVLVIDLAELERINSCGVRDWVNWQQNVSATGIQIVMIRCSPAIINQVNMVTNFIGDAVIHSFYAPYFNPETDEERSVLLFTKDVIGQSPVRAPEVRCETTGYLLEFDDFEESYFAFATTAADPRELATEVMTLVEGLTPELSHHNATSVASTTRMTQKEIDAELQAATRPVRRQPPSPESLDNTAPRRMAGASADVPTDPAAEPSPLEAAARQANIGTDELDRVTMPVRKKPASSMPASGDLPPRRAAGGFSSDAQSHFVTDPRAARGAGAGQVSAFAEPLESEARSSAAIIAVIGVVLVVVFGVLVWLAFG